MGEESADQKFLHHFAPDVTAIHAEQRRLFAAREHAPLVVPEIGLVARQAFGVTRFASATVAHCFSRSRALSADMGMPALSKVVKSYWDIDDRRLAMLTRLKA